MTGRYLRHIDLVLLAAVAGTVALALVTLGANGNARAERQQLTFVVLGAALGLATLALDPARLRPLTWWLYGGLLVSLVVVLGAGGSRGASRWITLPGFQLQPSEIGKLIAIAALAAYLTARRADIAKARVFVGGLLVVGVPALLVFIEPDLGTAIVYLFAALAMLFVAGARVRHVAGVLVCAAAVVVLAFSVLPAAGLHVLRPYQQSRLTAFLDPASSGPAAYQSAQSRIAIGSGGLLGRGARNAVVTNGNFLPEYETDFAFSAVGEQRGFVGTALLLTLLGIVVWRAMRTVTLAATFFESLIAAGLGGMLLTQIFVNVGMTVGIMPTTGIPLPFMTRGGSNTIANLIAIGLLCGIQMRGAQPEEPALAHHEVVQRRGSRLERA